MAQNSQLSQQEKEDLAETLAQKLNYYALLQVKYCAFLRTDPSKMQKEIATFNQRPEVVPHVDPYCFDDVDGLLAQYDSALAQPPKTYEEYCTFMHYAFAAAVLFNEHKVVPYMMNEKGFKPIFDKRFAQLHADSLREMDPLGTKAHLDAFSQNTTDNSTPSTSTSPAAATTLREITQAEAHALLADPATFMEHRFVCLSGSEDVDENSFPWRVLCYHDGWRP